MIVRKYSDRHAKSLNWPWDRHTNTDGYPVAELSAVLATMGRASGLASIMIMTYTMFIVRVSFRFLPFPLSPSSKLKCRNFALYSLLSTTALQNELLTVNLACYLATITFFVLHNENSRSSKHACNPRLASQHFLHVKKRLVKLRVETTCNVCHNVCGNSNG